MPAFPLFLRYAVRLKTHAGPNATPEDKQLAALWLVDQYLLKDFFDAVSQSLKIKSLVQSDRGLWFCVVC